MNLYLEGKLKKVHFDTSTLHTALKPSTTSTQQGFWTILNNKGGFAPSCRDNATLALVNGNLILVGGTRPTYVQEQLEAYTFSTYSERWSKFHLKSAPWTTKGSKPVFDAQGNCYIFSGETLDKFKSSTTRICVTDLHKVDLASNYVHLV